MWKTISEALARQIESAPGILGKHHDSVRWTEDPPGSKTFLERFVIQSPKRVGCWMTGFTDVKDDEAPDEDATIIRTYTVKTEGFLGAPDSRGFPYSDSEFRERMVEPFLESIRLNPSDLGGACHAISNPQISVPRQGTVFYGIPCHYLSASYKIEELLTRPTPTPVPYEITTTPNSIHFFPDQVALALRDKIAGVAIQQNIIPNVNHISLDRSILDHPYHPSIPRSRYPLIRIRVREFTAEPQTGTRQADSQYAASVWLYMLQTPGAEHQQELLAKLGALQSTFLGSFNLHAQTQNFGLTNYAAIPTAALVYKDVRHRFGCSDLQLSVGELKMRLDLRAKLC